ncbi:MAG: TonB-dependent receptor [Deltaproteobacteria bacterium]|nr:TonB-dependent receptor [Deltaproteobacteria bacterium]
MWWLLSLAVSHAAAPPDSASVSALSAQLQAVLAASTPADPPLRVVVVPSEPAATWASAVRSQLPGAAVERVAGGMVQVRIAPSRLGELAGVPGVGRVRAPYRPSLHEVQSEALDKLRVPAWHEAGYLGEGVRIAVLDVGFSGYEALLGTELPAAVETHFFGDPEATDHGTSVAELLHDVAPGAAISLYSFETEVEFMAAMEQIAADSPDIVNASVGFNNVFHADDTSPYSRAVDQMAEDGITWVVSAGNEALSYWVGALTDADGDGWADFDGSNQIPVLAGEGKALVSLRWDEPFGQAGTDLDLYLRDGGVGPCASSTDPQLGAQDPLEIAGCYTSAEALSAAVKVPEGFTGPLKAWFFSEWDLPEEQVTWRESLGLPADASGAVTVGAVPSWDNHIAIYSSRGPTNDGRLKPDVVGFTQVSTSTAGELAFGGTSASSPHTAGLAALLLEASGYSLDPDGLRAALVARASDLGEPGPDNVYGAGLVRLDEEPPAGEDTGLAEPPAGCGCTQSPRRGAALPGALLLIAGALLRRRRGAWLALALVAGEAAAADGDDEGAPVQVDPDDRKPDDCPQDEIVVTGTRTPTLLGASPVAVELITRDEIEGSGAQDLAALLESHHGVEITRSFRGSALSLQGLEPEHVLILVNGERVLGRKDGALDLSRYALDDVDRVEIVKGPSSALYGSDAMGGVINIITRNVSDPVEVDAQLRGGSRETLDGSATLGLRGERLENLLTAGVHGGGAYDLDPSDVSTTGDAYRGVNLSDKLRWTLGEQTWLTARGAYTQRQSVGIDANETGAVFDRTNLSEEAQGSLSLRTFPSDTSELSAKAYLTVFRDQYLLDQRGDTALDLYQDTGERMAHLETQYSRTFNGVHCVTAGLEGFTEQMRSDRLQGGEGARQRVALFLQEDWKPQVERLHHLEFVPGLRLDRDSQFGFHSTPKLSVRVDPSEAVVLRAGAGVGYRAPAFKELLLSFDHSSLGYVIEGNPDLQPETSRNLSLGVEVGPCPCLQLSVSSYYNDIDGLIAYDLRSEGSEGQPATYTYVNIAQAVTRGVESSARLRLPAGWRLRLGYHLNDTLDKDLGVPLEGRALHSGTVQAGWEHPRWGTAASLRGSWTGRRPYYTWDQADTLVTTWAGDFAMLDLRLSQPIGTAEVFAGIDNLLDVTDVLYLNAPPRLLYLGVSGRLTPARGNRTTQGER